MAVTIDIEIRGLREAEAKVEQVVTDMHGAPILQAFRDGALIVTADAKRLAPVDTGRLRASITPEVRLDGQDVLGVVGSNVEYAPYMELGTRPHWPPISALETWASRHGIPAFVVALSIARKGLAARRYLQGAFEKNERRVIALIERAVEKIVEK